MLQQSGLIQACPVCWNIRVFNALHQQVQTDDLRLLADASQHVSHAAVWRQEEVKE